MYFLSNGTEVTPLQSVTTSPLLDDGRDSGGAHNGCVVNTIVTESDFFALSGEWAQLHAASTFPSPFTSWEWCWTWWRHFGLGRRLRIAAVRNCRGELVAIAPLYVTSEGSLLLSRELRMIGDDGRDGEGMTDEPTFLFGMHHRKEALEALLKHVHAGPGSTGWDAGKLRVPTSRSTVDLDVATSIRELPSWRTRWEEGSQIVSLPNSWAAFRKSLSRSMKDNLSYYPRRMEKHGHRFCVKLVRDTQGIQAAVDALADLHNKRAANDRGAFHISHIPSRKHVDFLRDCLPKLAALGMASIAVMEVNSEIVAAQAMLESPEAAVRGRELVLYYSGYGSEWHEYSPVTILGATAMEEAIQRGIDRVNFLPGETMWKTRWGTSEQGAIADLRCLRTKPMSLARVFFRSTFRQASRQLLSQDVDK